MMDGGNGTMSLRKMMTIAVVLVILVIMYILFSNMSLPAHLSKLTGGHWVPYQYRPDMISQDWFEKKCLQTEAVPSALEDLPNAIELWKLSTHHNCRALDKRGLCTANLLICYQIHVLWVPTKHYRTKGFKMGKKVVPSQQLYITFIKIYHVTTQEAEVVLPSPFLAKVKGWLGNNDKLVQEAYKQKVIMIYDEYTNEQNTYNPIRSKRPLKVPEVPEEKSLADLLESTQPDCDFCKYKDFTAKDVFGRIDNKYSFSASNTFKLDRWHALFMMKSHNPVNWTQEMFLDLMDTKMKWFEKVYKQDSSYIFPSLIWDVLPAAGASQIHPHVHGFLDKDNYQGTMESWRRAALHYNRDFPGRNYFADVVQLHHALGLTVTYGKAIAFANLVPKKDNEVVIISEKADEDFYLLWYFVIRGFLDDMKKYCYSSGIALPSMLGDTSSDSLPAYVRIVTRGAIGDLRSDVSSLELFTSTNANTDPYKVIDYMKKSVQKRASNPII